MAELPLDVVCPGSVAPWSARPRARTLRPQRGWLVCPSCGRRLELVRVDGRWRALADPRDGVDTAHRVLA